MVNFHIEITRDRVSVSTSSAGWRPKWPRKPWAILSSLILLLVVASFLLSPNFSRAEQATWLMLPVFALIFARALWEGFRALFPTGESLVCDGITLTIGGIPRSSFNGGWIYESFPVSGLKYLQFGGFQRGRYGAVTALLFEIDGQKKHILTGLESPEAAKILDGLASLGVNVLRDPGMPMLVDMALSRRKRWGGLF